MAVGGSTTPLGVAAGPEADECIDALSLRLLRCIYWALERSLSKICSRTGITGYT